MQDVSFTPIQPQDRLAKTQIDAVYSRESLPCCKREGGKNLGREKFRERGRELERGGKMDEQIPIGLSGGGAGLQMKRVSPW